MPIRRLIDMRADARVCFFFKKKVLGSIFLKRLNLAIVFFSNYFFVLGCGDASVRKPSSIEGFIYEARLTRLITESEWTEVSGIMRFYLFGAGIFRQEAISYVEPQLFGPSEACQGIANGVFYIGRSTPPGPSEGTASGSQSSEEGAEENDGVIPTKRKGQAYIDTLYFKYDPGTSFKGLCSMNDRSVLVYRQPSGALDVIDGRKMIRFDRKDSLD